MAALFKRSLRPGPIAPFKTWPKVSTIAAFKMRPKIDTLGPGLRPRLKSVAIRPLLTTIGESYSRIF